MSRPGLTILVVDDSCTGAESYKSHLEQDFSISYKVLTVKSDALLLTLERSPTVDVVVLVLGTSIEKGISVLKFLYQQFNTLNENDAQSRRYPPLIVIGDDSVEHAVQALKAGASDYLVDAAAEQLHHAIQNAIATPPSSQSVADSTHHDQLEDQLQKEIAEIEAIYQSAPIGLAIVDCELRYKRINERLAEINGFSIEAHIGQTVGELLPDLKTSLETQLNGVITSGEPITNLEVSGETPAQPGIERHWLSHFVPIKNKELVVGISIVCEEITERVRAAEALQQSEIRFRNMADKAPVMIWLADTQGNCTYMSQSWSDFTGRPESALLGTGWMDSIHPDDLPKVHESVGALEKPSLVTRFEYRLRSQDGSYHWMLDTAAPWFDAEGKVEGYIGSVLDISDRQKTEEALRRSEERYRLLFESMNDSFFVVQMIFDEHNNPIDYRFLEVNPVFEKLTGLKNAVGKTAREVLPTVDDHWFERYGRVALTGVSIHFEHTSDAVERWFDVSAFRIGSPETHRVAILFKDVSDRKRAEEARRQVEVEREQLLVREQTAREAAERANRIKDEFLAVLSHELRSPLNPILGWTQLLQTQKLDETDTAEALDTIERNVRLQTQLIDDLLDVAKILRGKLNLEVSAVDLVSVIEAAMETVQTAADSKAIALYADLPRIGRVAGDAARLQQIVWNLLSNAVKFTPSGGRVEISIQRVEQDAHIVVSDNGKGINPEFLPRIFEQFHQEDASTTRKYGGLGLGLSIVRQLVEAHGGDITANSAGEGLGATFTVQIPLLLSGFLPSSDSDSFLPELDLTDLRILAVDDEPDARQLLRVLLTQHGAKVTTAESAHRAIALIESEQPDVLVSDIGMPDVDGYALLQQIRSLPANRGGLIPAIALTAYARKEDYQKALDSGFQEHIAKPVDMSQLIRAVLSVVPKRV